MALEPSVPLINLDIIRLICQWIVYEARPDRPQLLIDPYIRVNRTRKKKQIDGNFNYSDRAIILELSPMVQAQETLRNLCLVSKTWNYEARKALWASGIQFGLPRSFETVVKTVDPIGSFFDGGAEPDWLSSPPASRNRSSSSHFSPKTKNLPSITTSTSSTKHPESRHDSSTRRSISLVRKDGNYVLQPHLPIEDYSSENHFDHERSLSPPSTGNTNEKKQRRESFECTISPIRGRIAVQSLSKAFRRTSVTSPIRRQVGSPDSVTFIGNGFGEMIPNDLDEEAEEEEFIFDQQIDDIFNPAPYITSISFSKYRSHGMRRSIGEGHQARFVTPERLNRLLKSTRSRYSGLTDVDLMEAGEGRRNEWSPHVLIRRGKLEAVGFSEYMDSAISKEVLDEILLRGGVEVEYENFMIDENVTVNIDCQEESQDDTSRGRTRTRKNLQLVTHKSIQHPSLTVSAPTSNNTYSSATPTLTTLPAPLQQGQTRLKASSVLVERRLESSLLMETPIRALDLCGCISPKFQTSLHDFIEEHALSTPYLAQPEQYKTFSDLRLDLSGSRLKSTIFPYLTRLGLSRMITLSDLELANLLSGFVNLLDLDISHTRAGPIVLHTLQLTKKRNSPEDKTRKPSFRSLNLAKCRGLTRESLLGFLCGDIDDENELAINESRQGRNSVEKWEDPIESIGGLEELSLYGDSTLPTPLDSEGLRKILKYCPSFLSGKLTSLDLSSIDIDDREIDLYKETPDQPNLLQFGIGTCSKISLRSVAKLMMSRMRSVEVLDLSWSCSTSRQRTRFEERQGYFRTVPAISAVKLHEELIDQVCCWQSTETGEKRRLTNLRVIELEDESLKAIRGGARGWKVAFGKGQRGWYVDLSVSVKVISQSDTYQDSEQLNNMSQKDIVPVKNVASSLSFKRVLRPLEKLHDEDYLKGSLTKKGTDEERNDYNIQKEENEELGDLEKSLLAIKSLDETIRHTEIGWMSRKTEILYGSGMLGRQDGLYGFHGYSNT
ncbi:hypothetical protein PPACK8108_LOCUS22265 [Phakopsora pachyrhizi]|uniref:F-box domain-containing protein n=1 Tax=Phakopsora pachyrhizi TaxID=170000 RepID=A0AAV0BM80_PHAPC|nr:hypothetical protein PPACK8108_LOCUS22265 [Phakopsora pachyrhizi]